MAVAGWPADPRLAGPIRRPSGDGGRPDDPATIPLIAASNGKALWYLTRSTGMVALLLLTATVVLGVVASVGWTTERWPRFLSQSVHRNLSLFCVGFVAVHVITTVSDGYVPIGLADAFLPFRISLPTGLGGPRCAGLRPPAGGAARPVRCATASAIPPGGSYTGWPICAGRSPCSTPSEAGQTPRFPSCSPLTSSVEQPSWLSCPGGWSPAVSSRRAGGRWRPGQWWLPSWLSFVASGRSVPVGRTGRLFDGTPRAVGQASRPMRPRPPLY